MSDKIWMQLRGGIGNQLFQYSAVKWLAKKTSKQTVLDARLLSVEKSHSGLITDFQLKSKVLTSSNKLTWSYLKASLDRLMLGRLFPLFPDFLSDFFKRRTHMGSLGYDPALGSSSRVNRVKGFFQTYIYAQEFIDELRDELFLIQESPWLREQSELLKSKNVLAVHVRRGDYVPLKNSFGILSIEYYRQALSELRDQKMDWDEVWVFSDEPKKARVLMEDFGDEHEIRFIDPPDGTNALESLVLFSRADLGVIANSTFSWWACFLAKEMKAVVAPDKWFLAKEDPNLLIPEGWLKVKSVWER